MKRILFTIVAVATAVIASAQIQLTIEYNEVQSLRGELYQYSERYLGPCDVLTDEGTTYELKAIYRSAEKETKAASKTKMGAQEGSYKHTQMPVALSEEALMAGNLSKKAEMVAKQIYRIREARLNLLSCEVEHMPADGKSMQIVLDELRYQERQLVAMFVGQTHVIPHTLTINCPDEDTAGEVLLRFSKFAGPVDKDNLSGEPIKVTINNIKTRTPIVNPTAKKNAEPVYEEKVVRTNLSIEYGQTRIYETTMAY